DYNLLTAAFTSAPVKSSASAWQSYIDPINGPPQTGDILVNGRDIKNGLEAFNANQLVTSLSGLQTAWDTGGVLTDIHPNTPDAYWNILKDNHVIAGPTYNNVHNDQIVGAQATSVAGLDRAPVGIGDFSDNPGETNMILRDLDTALSEIYDIHHASIASGSAIGAAGTDWQSVGITPYQSAAAAVASSANAFLNSIAAGLDPTSPPGLAVPADPLMTGQSGSGAPAAEISAPTWTGSNASQMLAGSLFQHA
ncbi:MAG TPA: hypothetical protein VH558_16270, partial [Pseudolabrys sp.]